MKFHRNSTHFSYFSWGHI